MAKPINHNTGSELVTGTWEAAKGAAVGALAIPVMGAILGAVIGGVMLSGVGTAAVIGAAIVGAGLGGVGGGALALTPIGLGISGALAAVGGLLGLGHGANKISEEKAAYQNQQMASQRATAEERSLVANQGLQQGYQVGFQEGQAFAVQRIQQELQQQAATHHQNTHTQNTMMGQAPVEGKHVQQLARAGHQHHATKTDMVAHQKEQAAEASPQVG
jgi:hypothetical protein